MAFQEENDKDSNKFENQWVYTNMYTTSFVLNTSHQFKEISANSLSFCRSYQQH